MKKQLEERIRVSEHMIRIRAYQEHSESHIALYNQIVIMKALLQLLTTP